MGYYDDIGSGRSGERVALPETVKGKPMKDLFVIKPVGEPKTLRSGATRYSLLVGSRSVDGTAFLKIDLQKYTTNEATTALAFNTDKNKRIETAIAEGRTTAADIDAVRQLLMDQAISQTKANNTPEETLADIEEYTDQDGVFHAGVKGAITKAYDSLLASVQINVGTIVALQKASGQEPNPETFTPESVVGATFTGSIKPGLNETSEVGNVSAPATKTVATKELVTA